MNTYWLYWLADVAVRVLPARAADACARWLARAAFALRPPARRALERNLDRLEADAGAAHSDTTARTTNARQAFEHFALSFADFLRLGRAGDRRVVERVEVRGAEFLEAARRGGGGVIVLSAHLGNWEWGAAYLAACGARVHVAARPHPSPRVDRFFVLRRLACGVRSLESRPLWLGASLALRRGDWVAVMGDRRAPGRGGSLCAWAAALASRTGATVLPAVMLRLADGRYAACFEPPLTAESCRSGGYRDVIRRYLARYPDQWCAFEPVPEALA